MSDIVKRLRNVIAVFEDEKDPFTRVDVPLGLVREAIREIESLLALANSRYDRIERLRAKITNAFADHAADLEMLRDAIGGQTNND